MAWAGNHTVALRLLRSLERREMETQDWSKTQVLAFPSEHSVWLVCSSFLSKSATFSGCHLLPDVTWSQTAFLLSLLLYMSFPLLFMRFSLLFFHNNVVWKKHFFWFGFGGFVCLGEGGVACWFGLFFSPSLCHSYSANNCSKEQYSAKWILCSMQPAEAAV